MSVLKVLVRAFGKWIALNIYDYYVANLYRNVINQLRNEIKNSYKYLDLCKKNNYIYGNILPNIPIIKNSLEGILKNKDIPLDYHITNSDKDIHLRYSDEPNLCYCSSCFNEKKIYKKHLAFYQYFKYAKSINFDPSTCLKIQINTLKKIQPNITNDFWLLRDQLNENVFNYYKSQVPAHLQHIFKLQYNKYNNSNLFSELSVSKYDYYKSKVPTDLQQIFGLK